MAERYVLSQERLGLEAPPTVVTWHRRIQQEWIDCNRVWLTNSSGIAIGCVLYSSIATSIMRDVVCVISISGSCGLLDTFCCSGG